MVAKLGEQGSLLAEGGTGRLVRIPCLPVNARDTTGAGDAYCGGFLAGIVAGRPVAEAAAMGTVSASYVVEAVGALATALPSRSELKERLERVLQTIATPEANRKPPQRGKEAY